METCTKRLIYDYNSYFDSRDMSASTVLAAIPNLASFKEDYSWEITESALEYRDKTKEELEKSTSSGTRLVVQHYVVDFVRRLH